MKKKIFLLVSLFTLNSFAATVKFTISKKNCDAFEKQILNCSAGLSCYFEGDLDTKPIQFMAKIIKLDQKKSCSVIYREKRNKVTKVVLFSYNSSELMDFKKILKLYNSAPNEKLITVQTDKCCTKKDTKLRSVCKLKIGNEEFENVFDTDGYYECDTDNLMFPLKIKQYTSTK